MTVAGAFCSTPPRADVALQTTIPGLPEPHEHLPPSPLNNDSLKGFVVGNSRTQHKREIRAAPPLGGVLRFDIVSHVVAN